MKTAAVICEYNPFHNGHKKQIDVIRETLGSETAILCLMSGNFVQRGEPALFSKEIRAEAALRSGADLILELPVIGVLQSAEGYASSAVKLLNRLNTVDYLSFGCENPEYVKKLADTVMLPEYTSRLREKIASGLSYAAANEAALGTFPLDEKVTGAIKAPNNILAVEYLKAIARTGSRMYPVPILRKGSYHSGEQSTEAPSAEQIRLDGVFIGRVPAETLQLYSSAKRYSRASGERAMLAVLRCLPENAYDSFPYATEGLWNKICRNIASGKNLEDIIQKSKSKRYPYSRISRMVMSAFLGIDASLMTSEAPYVRILGFSEKGRELIKMLNTNSEIPFLHAGEKAPECAYSQLESRARLLYELFSENELSVPQSERVIIG